MATLYIPADTHRHSSNEIIGVSQNAIFFQNSPRLVIFGGRAPVPLRDRGIVTRLSLWLEPAYFWNTLIW